MKPWECNFVGEDSLKVPTKISIYLKVRNRGKQPPKEALEATTKEMTPCIQNKKKEMCQTTYKSKPVIFNLMKKIL